MIDSILRLLVVSSNFLLVFFVCQLVALVRVLKSGRSALFILLVSLHNSSFAGSPLPISPFDIPQGAYEANFVEDENGVAVIKFSGNYDRQLSPGVHNAAARAAVAQEFYEHYEDNYDFLVTFSSFEYETLDAEAFAVSVQNDIEGIGLPVFSFADKYGSEKLQTYIDMAALSRYELNPFDVDPENLNDGFNWVTNVLAHETLHRWSAFPELDDLKGPGHAHWNFYLNTQASLHYGHDWSDNNDGTFTAKAARLFYSPLDLYLMGMISPEDVPDTFVIEPSDPNNGYAAETLPLAGVTVSGARKNITIEQFIDANGKRIPSHLEAPKTFRFGFIYLIQEDETLDPADIVKINHVQRVFQERFPILTRGRGIAQTHAEEILPFQPGEYETISDDSGFNDQLSIRDGLQWLREQQLPEGNWQDKPDTEIRDTTVVLKALTSLDNSFAAASATTWLNDQVVENVDSIARRLTALSSSGVVVDEMETLINRQNADGGWGLIEGFDSSALDTALVLGVLTTSGRDEVRAAVAKGLDYIASQQNSDGGWGVIDSSDSSVAVTADILSALLSSERSTMIDQALQWLSSQQNVDDGFGMPASTVSETAAAVLTLFRYQQSSEFAIDKAVSYLTTQQLETGSWEGSVFTTAQVLQAIQTVSLPNLAIATFSAKTQAPYRDGQRIDTRATVINDSSLSAENSVIRFYQGDPDSGGELFYQLLLPEIPAFSSITIPAVWDSFNHSGSQHLFVVVDAEQTIVERSETDNKKSFAVFVDTPPTGVELEVANTDFVIAPNMPSQLPAGLAISALIRNLGVSNADNVMVALYEGEQPLAENLLESQVINIANRTTTAVNFTHSLTRPGETGFILWVDSQNAFTETDEDNNLARTTVATVDALDIEVLSSDINMLQQEVVLSTDASFTATIRNKGTVTTPTFQINFELVTNSGSQLINSVEMALKAGEERQIDTTWLANSIGSASLVVTADAVDAVAESNEQNNQATLNFSVENVVGSNVTLNYKDINFNPSPALEGFPLQIESLLRNNGTQVLNSVVVSAFSGEPAAGQLLGEVTIPTIAAGENLPISIVVPKLSGNTDQFIYLVADLDNQISEINEMDNVAFTELQVSSLPDFSVSSESIMLDPEFPKVGETVVLTISVNNSGRQSADAVLVRLYDDEVSQGGQLLLEKTMAIPSSGAASFDYQHKFDQSGDNQLVVVVNPDNQIAESNQDNNQAIRRLSIQSEDFYVSQRFLSPDGNGINDEVEYVYTINTPSTAIVILDKRNLEVQQIPLDLSDQAIGTRGRFVWQGENQQGGLLADGRYRFAIKGTDGQYYSESEVILDTNRSALSEALGTEFALSTNLSCGIGETLVTFHAQYQNPKSTTVEYGPHDEFIYFATYLAPYLDAQGNQRVTNDKVLFPTGIYRADNNGADVTQLLDGSRLDPRSILDIKVSKDGRRLLMAEFAGSGSGYRFWTIGIEGDELREVATQVLVADEEISFIEFNADQTVNYIVTNKANGWVKFFRLADAEGAIAEQVAEFNLNDNGYDVIANALKFAKSSNGKYALVLLAPEAVYTGVLRFEEQSRQFDNENSLLLQLNIVARQFTVVADNVTDFAWSPIGESFLVARQGELALYGTQVGVVQSYSLPRQQMANFTEEDQASFSSYLQNLGAPLSNQVKGRIKELTWNPDGSEFVFAFEDHIESVTNNLNRIGPVADNVINSAQNYQTLDGIYNVNTLNSDVYRVAMISSLGVEFYRENNCIAPTPHSISIISSDNDNEKVPDSCDPILAGDELLSRQNISIQNSPNSISNHRLDKYSLPLVSISNNSLPAIEWGEGYSLRRLSWLNGARELLISGGDFSYPQYLPTSSSNQSAPILDTSDNDYPVVNLHSLLNLDTPLQDSFYIYPNANVLELANGFNAGLYPSKSGRFLTYFSNDGHDSCSVDNDHSGHRQVQSLLNLTADLKARKSSSVGGVLLDGTATDKHFANYHLDYADVNQADNWLSIAPPSNIPVIDGRFTTWVPPYIGNFYIRLTVTDLAGNQKQVIKRVNNSDAASISGVTLTPAYFSPNGDGVQDQAELNFRVLEPVNLTTTIYSSTGALVRTFEQSYDLIGSQQTLVWDGRDQNGLPAPDGEYRLVIQNYEFFVTLDNTNPTIIDKTYHIFQSSNEEQPDQGGLILDLDFQSDISDQVGLRFVRFEKSDDSLNWSSVAELATDEGEYTIPQSIAGISNYDYRFIAIDYAGNESSYVVNSALKRHRAHILTSYIPTNGDLPLQGELTPFGTNPFIRGNKLGLRSNPLLAETVIRPEYSDFYADHSGEYTLLNIVNTLEGGVTQIIAEYSTDKQIYSAVSVDMFNTFCVLYPEEDQNINELAGCKLANGTSHTRNNIMAHWQPDLLGLADTNYWLRFKLQDDDGNFVYTDTVHYLGDKPAFLGRYFPEDLEIPKGYAVEEPLVGSVEGIPLEDIESVSLWVKSIGSIDDPYYIDAASIIGAKVQDIAVSDHKKSGKKLLFSAKQQLGLRDEFGYQYRYTLRIKFKGKEEASDIIFWETPKKTLSAVVTPETTEQCGVEPSNTVNININSLVKESVIVLLGSPGEGEKDLAEIFYNANLPQTSITYPLDTRPLSAGNFAMRAIAINESGDREALDFYVPIVKQTADAAVTYPNNGERVCATQFADDDSYFANSGDKERFPLMGVEVQGKFSTTGPWLRYRLKESTGGVSRQPSYFNGNYANVFSNESWNGLSLGFNHIFDPLQLERSGEGLGIAATGDKRYFNNPQIAVIDPVRLNPVTGRVGSSGRILLPLSADGVVKNTLEVNDWSGAKVCLPLDFQVDDQVDGLELKLDAGVELPLPTEQGEFPVPFFSRANNLNGLDWSYASDEATIISMEVFSTQYKTTGRTELSDEPHAGNRCRLEKTATGKEEFCLLNDTQVAAPLNQVNYASGQHTLNWDGSDKGGTQVTDGVYHVYLTITDGCGNLTTRDFYVGIDNTAPELEILYPRQGDDIQVDVQVKGTASDQFLDNYTVSATQAGVNVNIGSGASGVIDDILADWNTFNLSGEWQIKLEAIDKLGNKTEITETLVIPARSNLISSHGTVDYFMSPNNDGRLDQLVGRTAFERAVIVDYAIINPRTQATWSIASNRRFAAGYGQIIWDGLDASGEKVADGIYQLQVVARDQANANFNQTELVEFEVDTTLPLFTVDQLRDDHIELAGSTIVTGAINDENAASYEFLLSGGDLNAARTVRSGDGNLSGILMTIPSDLQNTEAEYQAQLIATDLAGNHRVIDASLLIDLIPPQVLISQPDSGLVMNSSQSINVLGTVNDTFFKRYSVSIEPVDDSAAAVLIASGEQAVIDQVLADWNADSLVDGVYRLTVSAEDKSGLQTSESIELTIDNIAPTIEIVTPSADSYITQTSTIIGTAFDVNFREYELLIASGKTNNVAAFERQILSNKAIDNGSLFNWSTLPSDGDYTLKLLATDQAGNQSEYVTSVIVDTTPPDAVELDEVSFNRDTAVVSVIWQASDVADLAGYWLYRNGVKVNEQPLTETNFDDEDLPEGEYHYSVQVVDLAGLVSEKSNIKRIEIDLTPPLVSLFKPLQNDRVNGLVDIRGTAYSETDFKEYRLWVGEDLQNLRLITESSLPLQVDDLGQWNSLLEADNREYWIRLEAEDINGNIAQEELLVFVDNTAPTAPTDLQLELLTNGQDSQANWQFSDLANDLAGFLLYRNDKVVNAPSVTVGNLEPYFLSDTSYQDLALPDGSLEYVVYAVDTAGNISEPSNSVTITVERRAPKAVISNVDNGDAFEDALYLLASSEDQDIAKVVIQYRPINETQWLDIVTDTATPYESQWQAIDLPDGEYVLRAVATDIGGLTDPGPTEVFVEKRDITPPAIVQDVTTQVDGDIGIITWSANSDSDIDAYRIYSKCSACVDFIEVGQVDASETSYEDTVTTSGVVEYAVSAVDQSSNSSVLSQAANAIYFSVDILLTSQITYTGTTLTALVIDQIAETDANIQLTIQPSNGAAITDQTILFAGESAINYPLTLSTPGRFTLTAQAQLNNGQFKSRETSRVLFQATQPSTPATPVAVYDNVNAKVDITWDKNAAVENVLAYQLYRNDKSLAADSVLDSITASASINQDQAVNTLPTSDLNSAWQGEGPALTLSHVWSQPELVKQLTIQWSATDILPETIEVRARIEGGYYWLKRVELDPANPQFEQIIVLDHPLITDSVQLFFPGGFSGAINRIETTALTPLVAINEYQDKPQDGRYRYQVQAIDYLGVKSEISEPSAQIVVGDGDALVAPILQAEAQQQNAQLQWNDVPNAVSYEVYRDANLIGEVNALQYLDLDLINGDYAYFIKALDANRVASDPSNSVAVTIAVDDNTAPLAPYIFGPTDALTPIIVGEPQSDIVGLAEPDSRVFLYQHDAYSQREARASPTVKIEERLAPVFLSGGYYADTSRHHMPQYRQAYVSGTDFFPGALTRTVFVLENGVWQAITDLENIINDQEINDIYWVSNDILILHTDSNRFYAYDANDPVVFEIKASNASYLLQSVQYYSVTDQSLVGTFTKDLGTSSQTVSAHFNAATSAYTDLPDNQFLSVDHINQRILYVAALANTPTTALNVYHLETGEEQIIELPQSSEALAFDDAASWSLNGQYLALAVKPSATQNSPSYAILYNTVTQQFTADLSTFMADSHPQNWLWFGDQSLLFIHENTLWQYDALNRTETALVQQAPTVTSIAPDALELAGVDKSANILLRDTSRNDYWVELQPAGVFTFPATDLITGENRFAVIATDDSNNVSNQSDSISVIYQAPDHADLSVTAVLNPTNPVQGLDADIQITVLNQGTLAVPSYSLRAWLINAETSAQTLLEQTFVAQAAGEEIQVNIPWTPEFLGATSIIVQVDPQQLIDDVNRNNNSIILSADVVAAAKPELSLSLQKSQQTDDWVFMPNEELMGEIAIHNYGAQFNGQAVLDIIDKQNYLVTSLATLSIDGLEYTDSQKQVYNWNIGATYLGDYQIRARLYDNQGQLIETRLRDFTITGNTQVDFSVSTDQPEYSSNQTVTLSTTVSNQSINTVLQDAEVFIEIFDAQNVRLYSESKAVQMVLSEDAATLTFEWNIKQNLPQRYRVEAQLIKQGAQLKTDTTHFIVVEKGALSGSLEVPNTTIASNDQFLTHMHINNSGNIALENLVLTLELVDAQAVLASEEFTINRFSASEVEQLSHQFSTANLLGRYQIVLRASYSLSNQTVNVILDSQSVTVSEASAPVVEIMYPEPEQHINTILKPAQLDGEDSSGIDQLEYRLNNGAWLTANKDVVQNSRYTAPLSTLLVDGKHKLQAKARDINGYVSDSVQHEFILDTVTPNILLEGVANDQFYNQSVLPLITVSDLYLEQVSNTLNGAVYQSGTEINNDGDYTLRVIANDKAGNFAQMERRFIVDMTAPTIAVTGVENGRGYSQCVTPEIQINDAHLNSSLIQLNNTEYVSGTELCEPGSYQLLVKADDKASNQKEIIIEFTLVDQLTASTVVSDSVVILGDNLTCQHQVHNDSSLTKDNSLFRQQLIFDGAPLNDVEFSLNLQPGETIEQRFTIDTNNLAAGDYRCALQLLDDTSNWVELSADNFSVIKQQVNIAPIARDDELFAVRGAWSRIDVLENDSDENADPLTLTILTRPAHGNLIYLGEGRFNYFADFGYLGQDQFRYQISDGQGGVAEALVTIDVATQADCSFVPDHSSTAGESIILKGWAKRQPSSTQTPRYYVEIINTDRPELFTNNGQPRIDHPDCSLSYTSKPNRQGTANVKYRIKDVASNGQEYQSIERSFTLEINSTSKAAAHIVPILKLLLLDDNDE